MSASDPSELRDARISGYEGARPDIQALVPEATRRVLDLGCASGVLGDAIKRRADGRRVVGVEYDATYASEAAGRLDRVLVMDLDELPLRLGELADEAPFDCVIAADVLEHLRDPWAVLTGAASLLGEDGVVIVSLPNVRHWSVLAALIWRGSWPREPIGIFDATHLRWFTLRDAHALLAGAGLRTSEVSRQYWERRPLRGLVRRLDRTPLGRSPLAELLAYQHILVGRPRT